MTDHKTTIDFDDLEENRQKAAADKADLFDFYHENYEILVQYAKAGMEYALLIKQAIKSETK